MTPVEIKETKGKWKYEFLLAHSDNYDNYGNLVTIYTTYQGFCYNCFDFNL